MDDTDDYDDMFAGLPPDVLQNLFIRYYAMQEYYEMSKEEDVINKVVPPDNKQAPKPDSAVPQSDPFAKKWGISMVFNRIIHETINDLYMMNKMVEKKAKIVTALISNGKQISNRKNSYWVDFLNTPAFSKIVQAINLLSEPRKRLLKYSIMSISNLLLKLGINMSKVSVIPIQKFCTFECLNIPILSVFFLQNLQYRLFKSKNISDPNQQVTFLRQLPKISVIKVCKFKNNTDVETLQNGQQEFFTKNSKNTPVKNLQFIQIHQKSNDPYYPGFERKTKYPYIMQFDLEAMSKNKINSPFNFEVLLLLRNVVFPLIKDFKPDLIVYIEDYPCTERVMDEETRGLLLCEMAEETCCNKMYVFKQVGIDKLSLDPKSKDSFAQIYKIQGGEMINAKNAQMMQSWEEKYFRKYDQIMFMEDASKKQIQKIKSIFLQDLSYISLALIQKISFEAAEQRSHQYFYPQEYLHGIKAQLEKIKENQDFKTMQKVLKNKIEGIESMLWASKSKEQSIEGAINDMILLNLNQDQGVYRSFYNQMEQRDQPLITAENEQFQYTDEDVFYVKYYSQQQMLKVFIIQYVVGKKKLQMVILSKKKGQTHMKKEAIIDNLPIQKNYLQAATYIASNSYLYRGFGKFKLPQNPTKQYNSAIHQFKIHPNVGTQWELVAQKSVGIKSDGKQEKNIQIQKKKYGYGIWSPQNKTILFMGGYINTYNEEKISKIIYIIRNADDPVENKKVESLGKTNKLLLECKVSNQLFLHPFVYGIPFFKNNSVFIINGNGAYMNLSNYNKLFYTSIKISAVSTVYTGILKQGKLKIPEDVDEASKVIVFAELMNKCMIAYCNQVNVYNDVCCIRTQEEGDIFIDPIQEEKKNETQMKDEKEQKNKNVVRDNGISVRAFQILQTDQRVNLKFMI